MARPRTPTNVLEMRGAFKKNPQRARVDEPPAEGDVGPMPASFNAVQKAAWEDVIAYCHTGVLCRADSLAVEMAAVLLAEFRTNPGDMPAAKLARLDSLLGRFGMTPADRSKVSSQNTQHANPFNRFFNNGRPENG